MKRFALAVIATLVLIPLIFIPMISAQQSAVVVQDEVPAEAQEAIQEAVEEAFAEAVAEPEVEAVDPISDAWQGLVAARDAHSGGEGVLTAAMDAESRELGEYEAAQARTNEIRDGQDIREVSFHDAVRMMISVLEAILPVEN